MWWKRRPAKAGGLVPPAQKIEAAGMVGNGCAAFDRGGIVPDAHRRHRRDLDFGYGFAVADSGAVAVVQITV